VQPLTVDRYSENRITGSFVLIDPVTNATAAAGMIREATPTTAASLIHHTTPVSAEERAARWGHIGAHVHLSGPDDFANSVERALFLRGVFVVRPLLPSAPMLEALVEGGVLVLTHSSSEVVGATVGDQHLPIEGVDDLLRLLQAHSILKGELTR